MHFITNRTCPGCSVPEPYRSHDWALVPAKPGLQGWRLMNEWDRLSLAHPQQKSGTSPRYHGHILTSWQGEIQNKRLVLQSTLNRSCITVTTQSVACNSWQMSPPKLAFRLSLLLWYGKDTVKCSRNPHLNKAGTWLCGKCLKSSIWDYPLFWNRPIPLTANGLLMSNTWKERQKSSTASKLHCTLNYSG